MDWYLVGTIIGGLYLASGVISYGVTLAAFQRKFNFYGIAPKTKERDLMVATVALAMGPFGLFATLIVFGSFKYGLLLRPLRDEEINYGP